MPREEKLTGNIDWLTVLLYTILVVIGWFSIYSAGGSVESDSLFSSDFNSGKQLQWMVFCVVLAFFLLLVDSKFYNAFAYILYGLLILFLLSVFVIGVKVKGQQNWIRLGGFQMQPSELAKFAVSIAIAKFVSSMNVDVRKWKDKWRAFAIIIVPMLIVLLQGDTGSAIVFAAFAFVLYREGLESYYLIVGGYSIFISVLALLVNPLYITIGLALIAALIIYNNMKRSRVIWITVAVFLFTTAYVFSVDYAFNNILKPHQRDRVNVLFGKQVEKDKDYNIKQSIMAIGSGGALGKGYLNGSLTKLKYVPEQSTDFIFSSIGEEWGFAGSVVLISLFVLLLYRILFLAERQRSKFSRVYGYCVASILFFHFMVNIGMAIGVMPVIGIPLPFISYGGSSLLAFTLLLFIFIRLDSQRLEMIR